MEGSKSEAVFDSLNLNPQLFINQTINTIEDYVDEAFDLYASEASTLFLKVDRSKDLSNGIGLLRDKVLSVVDHRAQMWEDYCLKYCFAVPHGFDHSSLCSDQTIQHGSYDIAFDEQLDSLRQNLHLVGKRSAELDSELRVLERTSVSSEESTRSVNQALQLYNESSVDKMFKEMAKLVPELRAGVDRRKTRRMKFTECAKVERLKYPTATISDQKLEDLEMFMLELRKM